MKIMVTGGAGFIGTHSVNALVEEGHEVIIIDQVSIGKLESVHPNVHFYQMDILNGGLEEIFKKEMPEVVLHLAAQIDINYSQKYPVNDAMTNIIGTIKILELCKRFKVGKIVFSSSAAVYGTPLYLPIDEKHPLKPLSCYGMSKLTAEHYISSYCKEFHIQYTILRYANVYGPGQNMVGESGVISVFHRLLLQGKLPQIFGDGSQTRDFVYIKDVVAANMKAIQTTYCDTFNIGTGLQVTINDLYKEMNRLMGARQKTTYGNPRLGDIDHSCLNNQRAKQLLKWTPQYSLTEGLAETCQ